MSIVLHHIVIYGLLIHEAVYIGRNPSSIPIVPAVLPRLCKIGASCHCRAPFLHQQKILSLRRVPECLSENLYALMTAFPAGEAKQYVSQSLLSEY